VGEWASGLVCKCTSINDGTGGICLGVLVCTSSIGVAGICVRDLTTFLDVLDEAPGFLETSMVNRIIAALMQLTAAPDYTPR
jgi:hypothetical protein